MLGIRLTVTTVLWSAILATIAGLTYAHSYGTWRYVLTTVAALGAVLVLPTVHGGSAVQWAIRRWRVREGLTLARMVDAKGRAMVWDGRAAIMFIEIFGDQWALSVVEGDGATTTAKIPLNELRTELRQFDIVVKHIRIIEYGYKYANFDRASMSVAGAVGTSAHLLGGRTFLEIAIDLNENPNPVFARQKHGDTVADGLTRTVNIATDRVLRVFQTNNIRAKDVSPTTLTALHRDILGGVKSAAQHNQWAYAGLPGDASTGTVVTFVPAPNSWNGLHQNHWNEVSFYRQYTCMTLSTEGNRDRVEYATSYLVDDPEALRLLPSQGLRRENGRHVSRLSNVLPLVCDAPIDDNGSIVLDRDESVSLAMRIHPLGILLGTDAITRKQVFMHVDRGSSPLWVIGDDEYARRLVLRLSSQRHRIAVSVAGAGWDHLIDSRRSNRLVRVDNPFRAMGVSDVVVCNADHARELEYGPDSPAVIVVTDEVQALIPEHSIVREGDVHRVHVGKKTVDIQHELTPTERPWLEFQGVRT